MQTSIAVRALGILSLVALASGCTRMGQYPVQLSLDESMAAGAKSATVELVGVNVLQRENPNVRDTDGRQTLQFGANMAKTQTLHWTDEKWKVWKARGSYYLLVFGELPDGSSKLELPLNTKAWPSAVARGKNREPLQLIIHENQIECVTPCKPLE